MNEARLRWLTRLRAVWQTGRRHSSASALDLKNSPWARRSVLSALLIALSGLPTLASAQTPTITIVAIDDTASEVGPDTGQFTCTRVGNIALPLTATLSGGGTAALGPDYTISSTHCNFAAGSSTATVTITPRNDALVEGSETVIRTLDSSPNYTVGTPNGASITIADQPVPIVTIEATDAAASEVGPDTGQFTCTRVGDIALPLTATLSGGGTAALGPDYTISSTHCNFAAGSSTATVTITPRNDALVEGSETVIHTLEDGADYDLGTTTTATVTITDQPVPIVTIEATDAAASEVGPDTGQFTCTRVGDIALPLTATLSGGGTAALGPDYTISSTHCNFAAGSSTATVTVTPRSDTLVEGTETVIRTLEDGAQYDLGTATSATIIISDPLAVVTVLATDPSASEVGPDPGTFTISRTGSTTAPLTMFFTTSGTAAPDADYTALGTSVTIPAGASSTLLTVTPSTDTMVEGSETVILTLDANAAYAIGSSASATVTIVDAGAPLGPFMCYRIKSTKGNRCSEDSSNAGASCEEESQCGGTPDVTNFCVPNKFPKGLQATLIDQFVNNLRFDVKKPVTLCNPATANDLNNQDDDTHLEGYQTKLAKTDPPQTKPAPRTDVRITNQFHPNGELVVDMLKPDRLLIPTAKSTEGPVEEPNPTQHNVDHYNCFAVKVSKGDLKFPKGLQAQVVDQFDQPKLYDLKKPTRLCAPTDKNGEDPGAGTHAGHLLCYQVKPAKGQPKHQKVLGIHLHNQFGVEQMDTVKEEELCVPSTKTLTGASTSVDANDAEEEDE